MFTTTVTSDFSQISPQSAPQPFDGWKVPAKAAWGPGAWQDEADAYTWTWRGVACTLARHDGYGSWCGYVHVPVDHPAAVVACLDSYEVADAWGMPDGAAEITCNDGSGAGRLPWGVVGAQRVGVDCAHAGQLLPSHTLFPERHARGEVYVTAAEAARMVNMMADAVANFTERPL